MTVREAPSPPYDHELMSTIQVGGQTRRYLASICWISAAVWSAPSTKSLIHWGCLWPEDRHVIAFFDRRQSAWLALSLAAREQIHRITKGLVGAASSVEITTLLVSRYSLTASIPCSLPRPDRFVPPKGTI